MKNIITLSIEAYQKFFAIFLKNLFGVPSFCRFSPTCSVYAKQAIKQFGIIKGGYLTIKRIIRCNPFGSFGFDPAR